MNELTRFAIFFVGGMVVGAGWGIINFIKIITKQNAIIKHVVEGFFACVFVFTFFVLLINANYGVFRLYLTFAFALGFTVERKTLGFLFAKMFDWLYNKLCKIVRNIKQTKLAKRVLK